MKRIASPKTTNRDVASLIKAVDILERLKREIRGIPPLAPMSLNDLPLRQVRRARQPQIREIRDPKPMQIREAVPKSAQPPSDAVNNGMKDMPGLPGEKNNHHMSPAVPQKMIPPGEKPFPQPEIRRALASTHAKQQDNRKPYSEAWMRDMTAQYGVKFD